MNGLGNKEILSKNLKYYVDKSGRDRSDICHELGISYSTFTDWLNGNKYPRIDSIEKIANYFGIQKSDLIEAKEHEPEEIVILNRAAKKMTPENRKKLLDMARLMFKEDFEENDKRS